MAAARASPRYLDMKPTLKPVADSAILVEFENEISEAVSNRVLSLLGELDAAGIEGVIEAVPSYRTLLVYYNPLVIDIEAISGELMRLWETDSPNPRTPNRWRVPVWYGGPAAQDLESVARQHGLSEDEVIEIHSGTVYRVYLVGFAPGWTFLGGLDERLHTPRLDSPRAEVPAGSISIAGQQGLICGPAMPSGWNLIGQTPERTWAPEREEPFFIQPGDEVEIRRIDEKEFKALQARVEAGERVSKLIRDEGAAPTSYSDAADASGRVASSRPRSGK